MRMKEMYRRGLVKHLKRNKYIMAMTAEIPSMAKNNHQQVARSPI
jgi:hypothetical protein